GLVEGSSSAAASIDRRVELFKWSLSEAEAEIDKAAGQQERKKYRAVAVDRGMGWEDDRFFPAPVGSCHHARSASCRASTATALFRFLTSVMIPSNTSGVSFWPAASGFKTFISMSRSPTISLSSTLAVGSPPSRDSSSRMSRLMNSPR